MLWSFLKKNIVTFKSSVWTLVCMNWQSLIRFVSVLNFFFSEVSKYCPSLHVAFFNTFHLINLSFCLKSFTYILLSKSKVFSSEHKYSPPVLKNPSKLFRLYWKKIWLILSSTIGWISNYLFEVSVFFAFYWRFWGKHLYQVLRLF